MVYHILFTMDTTTVKISKKHSKMLDNLMGKLQYGLKKRLLEDMIEYFDRFPLKPRDQYATIDDNFFRLSDQFRDIKDELREIKKEIKKAHG